MSACMKWHGEIFLREETILGLFGMLRFSPKPTTSVSHLKVKRTARDTSWDSLMSCMYLGTRTTFPLDFSQAGDAICTLSSKTF